MVFDVIMPTYDNLEELKACLAGFGAQSFKDFRLCVCVDGSRDGTLEYLRNTHCSFPMDVLHHPRFQHIGRNATRNLALPLLKAEYVLLFDSDAKPVPELLAKHLEVLSGKNVISSGILYYSNTDQNPWAWYLSTRTRYHSPQGSLLPYSHFASGNVAFKAKYFIELGGQDAAMRNYGGGDIEFGIRLWDRYHLPIVNNAHACGYSTMNKKLDFALSQLYEFGKYNLPYIHGKHPGHRHIYNLYLMAGKGLLPFMYRMVMRPRIQRFFIKKAGALPLIMRKWAIHYSAAVSICEGFKNRIA
jgi:glycosyltransferase involved in cell wall biosynthesis